MSNILFQVIHVNLRMLYCLSLLFVLLCCVTIANTITPTKSGTSGGVIGNDGIKYGRLFTPPATGGITSQSHSISLTTGWHPSESTIDDGNGYYGVRTYNSNYVPYSPGGDVKNIEFKIIRNVGGSVSAHVVTYESFWNGGTITAECGIGADSAHPLLTAPVHAQAFATAGFDNSQTVTFGGSIDKGLGLSFGYSFTRQGNNPSPAASYAAYAQRRYLFHIPGEAIELKPDIDFYAAYHLHYTYAFGGLIVVSPGIVATCNWDIHESGQLNQWNPKPVFAPGPAPAPPKTLDGPSAS